MIEIETTVREWGGSFGAALPKDKLKKAHYKLGDKIKLLILPKENPLKGTFGILKFSKPVDELLKEVDREAWDD